MRDITITESIKSLKPSAVYTVCVGETKENTIIVFHDSTVLSKDEIYSEQKRLQAIEDAK